jgi:hypothetical protein
MSLLVGEFMIGVNDEGHENISGERMFTLRFDSPAEDFYIDFTKELLFEFADQLKAYAQSC